MVELAPQYGFFELLSGRWGIGVAAFAVSLVATPIVRFIAYRTKTVDRPDDLLKPHGRPVAYLGGIAMCMGLLTGLACHLALGPETPQHWRDLTAAFSQRQLTDVLKNPIWNLAAIAASSVLITMVGLFDDLVKIRPSQKVVGQVAAAAILLIGGVGIKMATVFLSVVEVHPPLWILMPLSAVMCFVIVIATCNATNLLDGLDGLCGGVTGIIALGFLVLAVWLAMWGNSGSKDMDTLRMGLCLAMAGAVLGFLPYNIPPASIFMGDAGSMLLGFFVATMMALFCLEGTARWFIAAWAVFALPTLDTGLAVVRRVLAGESIFAGDRSHLYDQLIDRGMTVRQVVVLFYILAAVAAAIGIAAAFLLRGRYAVVLYAVLLIAIAVIFHKLGMVKPESQSPAGGRHSPGDVDK